PSFKQAILVRVASGRKNDVRIQWIAIIKHSMSCEVKHSVLAHLRLSSAFCRSCSNANYACLRTVHFGGKSIHFILCFRKRSKRRVPQRLRSRQSFATERGIP